MCSNHLKKGYFYWKNSWFGRTFLIVVWPKLRFGSVRFLTWFGSAEPVKARFGRTLIFRPQVIVVSLTISWIACILHFGSKLNLSNQKRRPFYKGCWRTPNSCRPISSCVARFKNFVSFLKSICIFWLNSWQQTTELHSEHFQFC